MDTGDTHLDENQRLRRIDAWESYVTRSLDAGEQRMDRMEQRIEKNTEIAEKSLEATEAHRTETKELLEAFSAMKGGFQVLEWLAKIGKWVVGIGGAALFLWRAYNGKWPGS